MRTVITHNLTFSTRLDFRAVPPYSFELTVHKPAGWSLLTPFEVFEGKTLWTVLRVPSGVIFGLKMKSIGTVHEPRVSCGVYSEQRLGKDGRGELSRLIRWMLSADEDVAEFYALAAHDSLVRALVEDLYGMRTTKQPDIFPRLILAVTLQMAPIARSNQMMELLIKQYGEKARFDRKEILCWPSARTIADTSVAELERNCKLGYRSTFLRAIAETVRKGFPSVQELERMSPEEAKLRLMELKGIGEYSADIVSPHSGFALDVWSARIFHMLFFGSEPKSPRDVIPKLKRIAEERWGQWRGYVFLYVLHDLDRLSKRLSLDLTQA
jgi:3-methyladenine DNA glycosylase/8-oxoguanine DNA glycosylase